MATPKITQVDMPMPYLTACGMDEVFILQVHYTPLNEIENIVRLDHPSKDTICDQHRTAIFRIRLRQTADTIIHRALNA